MIFIFFKKIFNSLYVQNDELLKLLNSTLIKLVPRKTNATRVNFLPIALCNVLYKIISNVLTNKLKLVLLDPVGLGQSVFVSGRSISDNMILAQQLVRHYERKGVSPRAMLEIDVREAYYAVDWSFLIVR